MQIISNKVKNVEVGIVENGINGDLGEAIEVQGRQKGWRRRRMVDGGGEELHG